MEQSQPPADPDTTGLMLVRAQRCLTFQSNDDIWGRGSSQWMGHPNRRKAMNKGLGVGKNSKDLKNKELRALGAMISKNLS